MNTRQALTMAKQAASNWSEDRAPSMGAALSYYTVFSIAPLLLIAIAVAGLVFGMDAARGAIVEQLQGLLGESAAETIQSMLKAVSEPKQGVVATVIGVLLLLVGATTVFAELQDDLDRIWKAPDRAKPSGVWGWIRARILSFGMVLGIGFLLLVSLVASAALAALGEWWSPMFGGWEVLAHVVNLLLSFALVTVMFALIYRFMPSVKVEWHDVWIGAAVTSLLFTIGKFLIGLYIGKSSVTSGFGAAGSLAVMLLWVYYSAQIFLLGAEFTRVYAKTLGSKQGQADEDQAPQGTAARGKKPDKAKDAPKLDVTYYPQAGQAGAATRSASSAGATAAQGSAREAASGLASTSASGSRLASGSASTSATRPGVARDTRVQAPSRVGLEGAEPMGKVASGVQRHLLPAAGAAAALGALSVWLLQRARGQRRGARPSPSASTLSARQRKTQPQPADALPPPRPTAGTVAKSAAKTVAAGVASAAVRAMGQAALRGFKRGLPSS